MEEVLIKIYGQVQGVSFRYYTLRQAQALKLRGWVRNNPDGAVEVLAQGEKDDLENLIKWAKTGSDSARVKKVEVEWREPSGQYSGFEIGY